MLVDIQTSANTTVREALPRLAAQVLGLDQVRLDQSFFELGGSSLSAALLTEQLEGMLGLPVPIRLLYENPILADFAAALPAPRETSGS